MEFDAYSEWSDARTRVDKTEEGVQLILKLWQESKVDFTGKYYRAKNAILEPKPIQKPHPPLVFGGFSERMIRMAGKYADICYVPPWAKLSLEKAKTILTKEAQDSGRPTPALAAGAASFEGGKFDMNLVRRDVEIAQDIGCEYYVTPWFPRENYLETVKQFSREFMASFALVS
jgi:hypothetical protein